MLAHGLAIAVWVGSLALYGAAFFFPEVHRRHDFFWSGVGAFYGLVLWFCAAQTSPTELLGQGASVTLLGWLGWQTLTLRRKRTPLDLQTPLTPESWPAFGRQLKVSALTLLGGTPLERWLPEVDRGMKAGDLAIAPGEIRASSLKDVDYEFVDELAPSPRRAAPVAALNQAEPVVVEPAKSPDPLPSRAVNRPRPSGPQIPPVPQTPPVPQRSPGTPKPKATPLGARLAGLTAWAKDLVKAKTTPKPKRAVIEIPPRPSPLAKPKQQSVTPVPTAEAPSGPDQPPVITIVDTGAIESFETEEENWADDWGEMTTDPDRQE
jgi:hypothetical protein